MLISLGWFLIIAEASVYRVPQGDRVRTWRIILIYSYGLPHIVWGLLVPHELPYL